MSTVDTFQDIAAPEREILRSLSNAENTVMRRVDLADVVEEPYPPHERKLIQRDLIEEVGVHSTHEDGEHVVYRRLTLTAEGERLLTWADRHGSDGEEPEPDPVEPKTRPARREPWHKRAEWTNLSPDVNRLLEETQSVAFDEEAAEIHVTMEHDAREGELVFNTVAWFNTGHRRFAEQYHAAFNERNPIDEREFGILQARWVDLAGQGQDSDDNSDAPKTQKERAKAYLAGEGADDSVRAAAEHLDMSVGTVQNARSELNEK